MRSVRSLGPVGFPCGAQRRLYTRLSTRPSGVAVPVLELERAARTGLRRNNVDPAYRPDPQSSEEAQRVAAAGGGDVLNEDPGLLISQTKAFLGSGPHTTLREQRTRISLGPYVALIALLPLGFVLVRRNL